MKFPIRHLATVLLCLAFSVVFSAAAWADSPHDRTQVGHAIIVGAGEEVSEVTCFGCSIRVRGHVDGDATSFGGSVVVEDEGIIGGDVTTFGGGTRLGKNAKIGGDVAVFGGSLRRDPSAAIGGDVTTFSGYGWMALFFVVPFMLLGAFIALIVWIIHRVTRPAVPVSA
jgi:hypothetical protein